jgi:hypothetical protein
LFPPTSFHCYFSVQSFRLFVNGYLEYYPEFFNFYGGIPVSSNHTTADADEIKNRTLEISRREIKAQRETENKVRFLDNIF